MQSVSFCLLKQRNNLFPKSFNIFFCADLIQIFQKNQIVCQCIIEIKIGRINYQYTILPQLLFFS